MKIFTAEKYGLVRDLFVGQKVECIYYHEYSRKHMQEAYKRSWLSILIDKPFKPVKLGVIIGDAGIHPYWLAGKNRKERYLLVKFREYLLPKPIPISCIYDALEAAAKTKEMLERDKDKIGQKGYDLESIHWLTQQMNKAYKFVGK